MLVQPASSVVALALSSSLILQHKMRLSWPSSIEYVRRSWLYCLLSGTTFSYFRTSVFCWETVVEARVQGCWLPVLSRKIWVRVSENVSIASLGRNNGNVFWTLLTHTCKFRATPRFVKFDLQTRFCWSRLTSYQRWCLVCILAKKFWWISCNLDCLCDASIPQSCVHVGLTRYEPGTYQSPSRSCKYTYSSNQSLTWPDLPSPPHCFPSLHSLLFDSAH